MLNSIKDLWKGQLIIPTTFEECLTYGQRQDFMWKKIQELEEKIENLENKDNQNS